MEKMEKEYDIIQIPKGIKRSDLPERIEADKPFEIDGSLYVCEKRDEGAMKVCFEEEGKTSIPVLSKNFYVVRRV
ncbi:hypothetical protein EROM_050650 [Encephalitozoon romaleae SJ-2008]|uniref:Uncharacterized protein n=1 Tax=Encephalitozoon romaleae (strain SJ-2008) TaxID=1178016 RepID=I7ARJ5_ENCRO|nr:hypothetical protein EROM_050650 [Encephalitozoon romaleae SJ-2008]AFN82997.1 hypothetical protein EROM_050650 [Encephalitozoon romaleae SJ-2008]